MKTKFTRYSIALLFSFVSTAALGQIISYTNAWDGSLNSIAANVSATDLTRVNGATVASNPCPSGFSSGNYSNVDDYSTSLGAVEVTVTPDPGYSLDVTSFSADLGRSQNGPAYTRYAYSTDGGSTWISQTSTKYLQGGHCDDVQTVVWSTPVQIDAPATLKFRIYGFNARKTTAKQHILNLEINGTVSLIASPCATPTGIGAKNITSSSAKLDWSDVPGAESYNVQYRESGTTNWISNTSTTSSLPVSGLNDATSYEFQVQTACSGGMTSTFSKTATFITTSCAIATGLSAKNITSSSATLDWNDVSGAEGYNVQYRESGTTNWISNTSTTSSLPVSGLTDATNYEFRVQTLCAGGMTSAFSPAVTFITTSCAIATGLSAKNIASSSATLDWDDVPGAQGYNVQYREAGTTNWISSTSTTSSLPVSGLTDATSYEFRVQTLCAGGMTSAFSPAVTFTTTSCAIPTGLSAKNITSSSATLDWNDVPGAQGYNVQYREAGTTNWISNTSTTSSLPISGLTDGTSYEFRVQTVCAGGMTSAFSPAVTFTTTSCAIANGLSAKNITSSSATLDWDDVPGAQGYNVQYREAGTTNWISNMLLTSSLLVTALIPSTNYEFQVQTLCASGTTSAFSSAVTFTTDDPIVTNAVPAFSHIVVVIGENTNSTSVFGSSDAPYINALANSGAKFTNSFALTHPSQPNYLQLYSGSNQGVNDDSYITTKFTTPNLGNELIDAGKTYTTYSEGLPSVGYDGKSSGLYVRKHNPAANWMGTGTNQIPATTNQPFIAFPTDYNNLPSVSFVIPDLCNDGHDVCAPLNNSTLQYDTWIKDNLDGYKKWCINNNSLLIVTYDEDDFTSTNKIATVFYGANVLQGTYPQTINHYNVLRTMEDAFQLPTHAGAAASATPIDFCWTSASRSVNPLYSLKRAESNISESVDIFPDPANDIINVRVKNSGSKKTTWEITNSSGVRFKSGNVARLMGDGKIGIAVDNLRNGIYFLRISDGVTTTLKKFVIAR